MANINSLTSNSYSSSSSIYGNRNVLTGLASGMDTEAMIENSVTGYQTKIAELQQKQTKIEWKQDSYRELIDQMYSITNKYTSYTSATNLSSNSFFTGNVSTAANGSNADALTATGKASGDIQINAVTQLATSARYAVDAGALNLSTSRKAEGTAIDWSRSVTKGALSGTLTLKLGSSAIDVRFTEEDKYTTLDELVEGVNKKLEEQSASVKATLSDGEITFEATGEAKTKGDSVYISGASGNLKTMLNVTTATSSADEKRFEYKSFSVKGEVSGLTETMTMAQYLSGKTVDVTLDGVTKTIKIGDLSEGTAAELQADLQKTINREFGANRITVGTTDAGGLKFDVPEGSGSTLKVASSVGEELGIGKAGVSNYFNTGRTLDDLLGSPWLNANARIEGTIDENAAARYFDADGNELKEENGVYYRTNKDGSIMTKDGEKVTGRLANTLYTDTEGNLVKKYANESSYYRVNAKGEWLYDLKVNGADIDGITKDTSLESVLNKITSSSAAGVKVSYSNLTSQFVFTANETGEGGKISFDSPLAKRLFQETATGDKTLAETIGIVASDEAVTFQFGSGRMSIHGVTGNTTMKELVEILNNRVSSTKLVYDEETDAFSIKEGSKYESLDDIAIVVNGTQTTLGELFKNNKTANYIAGKDAVVNATVNGKELTLKRSSNVVNMDGLSVTLKKTFDSTAADGGDAVTFTTSSDSDKIVEAIKGFVEDVNKLMTSVHSAYTTQPIAKTSSSSKKGTTYYEPLTEEDKNGMSESAVEKYEEKAKTGLLFGDNDLRSLYDKLLNTIQSFGSDRVNLESIGLSTAYSGGVTTISLNESTLRAALDGDPDKVRNVFTKTTDSGAATNGLMASLKSTLNAYGSTSLASPGILVRKAGTKLSAVSLLHNNLYSQISNLDKQIEDWQTKLSSRVDYYTKQFTALEKMMSTMNNQSSMLADLMGY